MADVAPIRQLDDNAALDWLRSQPEGRISLPAGELGRRFGWSPQKAGRRLAMWERTGLIRKKSRWY